MTYLIIDLLFTLKINDLRMSLNQWFQRVTSFYSQNERLFTWYEWPERRGLAQWNGLLQRPRNAACTALRSVAQNIIFAR